MGRARIVLFSHDSRYADAFSEYCGRHEKERITVKTFTNEESLENCVSNESTDVLLTEEVPVSAAADMHCKRVVLLSETRYVKDTGYPSIYKYQRMDIILRQLYEFLAEEIGDDGKKCSIRAEGPDMIGCFSPCYEQEREQYARALAGYTGERGRTLFINMAMFTTYDGEGEDGLSELLYYLSNGEEDILSYRLPALSKHIGAYESLPGVKNYLDLYSLDKEQAGQLFDKLAELSEYKYVIVDLGVAGDVSGTILGYCKSILMPVPYNADGERINHLKRDYNNGMGSDVMDRAKWIRLPDWWQNDPAGRMGWIRETYEQY